MLTIAWLLIASTVSLQPDTTVVLGLIEETLLATASRRLSGLSVSGQRSTISMPPSPSSGSGSSQRRSFSDRREFVDSLRAMARLRVAEIPDVIARDRQPSDTRDGDEIWEEILKSPVTIFTFSPGGDVVVAIGWSARAGRFYRLLECC